MSGDRYWPKSPRISSSVSFVSIVSPVLITDSINSSFFFCCSAKTFSSIVPLASNLKTCTAFRRSGGAFGFRDQLQDVTAFLYTHPEFCERIKSDRFARNQKKTHPRPPLSLRPRIEGVLCLLAGGFLGIGVAKKTHPMPVDRSSYVVAMEDLRSTEVTTKVETPMS